jgi:hypothetical protein
LKVNDLDPSQIGSSSFVNLNESWNSVQIEAFQQSLHADGKAMAAATTVNDRLRLHGLLPLDQEVVGFFGGRFFTIDATDPNRRTRAN